MILIQLTSCFYIYLYLVVLAIKLLQVHNLQDDEDVRISMIKEAIYQDDFDTIRRNETVKGSPKSQKKEVVDLPKLRGSLDRISLGEYSFDQRMNFEGYVAKCELQKESFGRQAYHVEKQHQENLEGLCL